jgi:hypothetical protein
LGKRSQQQNVLARLGSGGKLLWRRSGPVDHTDVDTLSLRGDFDCLRADFDGSVYLPATRLRGVIFQVDVQDGFTPPAIDIGAYRGAVWIQGGKLYRVVYEDGRRCWAVRKIASGQEHKVAGEASLQQALAVPRSPLPDDGALLSSGTDLVWMGADGSMRAQLPLAGLVRTSSGLAIGVRENGSIRVELWSGGSREELFNVGPVSPHSTLIHVDRDIALVRERQSTSGRDSFFSLTRDTGRISQVSVTPSQLLALEGRVAVDKVCVEPDGSVLIAGADAKGGYVLRIRFR